MSATNHGLRLRSYRWLTVLLVMTSFACRHAAGQAVAAASRSFAIDAFAGVSDMKLDNGHDYNKYSTGFAVGADVFHRFSRFDIGIEPRYGHTAAQSKDDTQSYFLGDIVLSKQFRKFHVYGIGGIGYGKILHPQSNTQDNSIVYAVGPGLQYDLPLNLAVKADWQYQSWNVGKESNGFNPNGATLSVVYRFNFRH